jgi:predicted DNA-binding transcriptional regulator YafY
MNRIDRLLGVILLLQSRRLVTAEQMAAHFEISVRTVYRDLSALSEIGVPIAAEAGVGYTLLKGYHLPPVMFTEAEASALLTAGELVKQFTDASLTRPADSALLKIRAVLPREQREQAERILRHTAVLGLPRQPAALDREFLLPIQRAVALHRVLRLQYQAKGREQATAREVEPLGVVYYADAWYLIAWCRLRGDFRHFRLDRIRQLAVREATFEPRPGFSLRAHLAESVRKEDTVPARVRFTREAAERARSECFAGLVEERLADGRVEMDFLTFSLEWLARWLLSFGPEAEAVAPERLRELVKTEAEQVARLHGKTAAPRAGRRPQPPVESLLT